MTRGLPPSREGRSGTSEPPLPRSKPRYPTEEFGEETLERAATPATAEDVPIDSSEFQSPPLQRMPQQRPMSSTNAKTGRVRRAGMVDGRYELEALLSKGGMGRVFRARHRDLGRQVAVKLVLDGFQDDQELKELFFKEARLASSLNHPNIVSVTDFGLDDDLGYFVVMDLLSGETLRERLRRQRPTVRFACDVLDQVTGAVRYIHSRDVVHCDLKPENIFLSRVEDEPRRANIVKLLDFGLSWRRETLPDPKLGGTPPYLAPERLRGAPPAPASDVYSLGMIFYEMIAGRLPYHGGVAEIIDQQLNSQALPRPSKLAQESIDSRVDELIMRALSGDPAGRHPSAEAFHFELRALMTMMGMSSRRRGARVVESSTSLSAELIMLAVTNSPVPLAIFEPSGVVRFANHAFVKTVEGDLGTPPQNLDAFRIARRHSDLLPHFHVVAQGGRPQHQVVLAGTDGKETPRVLRMAPFVRKGVVESVHMTLLALEGAE
jgi:serine/threonine-protein kinase